MRRSFSDLLKIFDDEVSQNRPNMIDNLGKVCNEGCDLKRFMGEPLCKKCAAEPTIMSLVVPPEGIARNPKTRPPGKTWSEEKLVWRPNTSGVQRNPRRWGFTEQDVATKQFYKLKGSQPGQVSFRLGEDENPYITHDDYKKLSTGEREKWIKVTGMKKLMKVQAYNETEHGKQMRAQLRAARKATDVAARKVSMAKRQAKAIAQGEDLYKYQKRTTTGRALQAKIRNQREKAKALAGEKSTMYDPCPGALQKYCKKVKLRRFAACRKCFDATRND